MYSKNFSPFKDFQSDQIQRSSLKILTAHVGFDTSYGNDLRNHLSNNQFINRIFGGTLDLPDRKATECCLKHIKNILKNIYNNDVNHSASLTMYNLKLFCLYNML